MEEGAKTIKVKLSYTAEDGSREEVEKDVQIFIYEKEPPKLEIAGLDTSPARLTPGKSFTLSIQLENIGKQDAKAVKVELSPPQVITGSRTSYLGTIKQDDTSTAIFDLEVSPLAKPESYRLPLKVYYLDERGRLHQEEKEISLTVSKAEKRVSLKLIAGIVVLVALLLMWWRRRRSAQI